MARKKIYTTDKKTEVLSVKLSIEDWNKMMDDARAAGMDRSKYIRQLVQTGGKIDTTFPRDRAEIIRQVSGVANNINQIAKLANTRGYVSFSDVNEIVQQQKSIMELLREDMKAWQLRKSCA